MKTKKREGLYFCKHPRVITVRIVSARKVSADLSIGVKDVDARVDGTGSGELGILQRDWSFQHRGGFCGGHNQHL